MNCCRGFTRRVEGKRRQWVLENIQASVSNVAGLPDMDLTTLRRQVAMHQVHFSELSILAF